MNIDETLIQRQSIRAFRSQSIPKSVLKDLLHVARWSPSGGNLQPWRVTVVQGEPLTEIGEAMVSAATSGQRPNPDYVYYPALWKEPFDGRRKSCGLALYHALGIKHGDKEARREAWLANYRFFEAPVVLFFFMDRELGQGAWLDMGMFMQSVMLAAVGRGLGTCPQAVVADYPDIVRDRLHLSNQFLLLGGIAMGYPNKEAPVNNYRTEREEVEQFTTFHG